MLSWRFLVAPVAVSLALLLPGATAHARPVSYAAHVAEQLARDPVHVSDHYAGALDLEATRADIRDSASRLDFPLYVMVLPTVVGEDVLDEGFLAAVHDHLGEDGVYLLARYEGSVVEAAAYGVDAPAEDSGTEVLYSLEHDTPVTVVVDRFVDNLASGETAQRLEEARRLSAEQQPLLSHGEQNRLTEVLAPHSPWRRGGTGLAIGTVLGATAVFWTLRLLSRIGHLGHRKAARP